MDKCVGRRWPQAGGSVCSGYEGPLDGRLSTHAWRQTCSSSGRGTELRYFRDRSARLEEQLEMSLNNFLMCSVFIPKVGMI